MIASASNGVIPGESKVILQAYRVDCWIEYHFPGVLLMWYCYCASLEKQTAVLHACEQIISVATLTPVSVAKSSLCTMDVRIDAANDCDVRLHALDPVVTIA
jgi:hypothetical protein